MQVGSDTTQVVSNNCATGNGPGLDSTFGGCSTDDKTTGGISSDVVGPARPWIRCTRENVEAPAPAPFALQSSTRSELVPAAAGAVEQCMSILLNRQLVCILWRGMASAGFRPQLVTVSANGLGSYLAEMKWIGYVQTVFLIRCSIFWEVRCQMNAHSDHTCLLLNRRQDFCIYCTPYKHA